MKIKTRFTLPFLYLIISFTGYSQNKIGFKLGASIPEGYHAGILFQYNQNNRIDISYGTDLKFTQNNKFNIYSIYHAFFLGKTSKKTQTKLWALNFGLSYLYEDNAHERRNNLYMNIFGSRDIPLTKKLILHPELGVSFLIYDKNQIKDEMYEGNNYTVIPKFGLSLIYIL
jgi:hypothetical protein